MLLDNPQTPYLRYLYVEIVVFITVKRVCYPELAR